MNGKKEGREGGGSKRGEVEGREGGAGLTKIILQRPLTGGKSRRQLKQTITASGQAFKQPPE